jgi:D-3-phosphoglycerate dehydrogenase
LQRWQSSKTLLLLKSNRIFFDKLDHMYRVLITTVPFADKNRLPLELLEAAGIEYVINPHNKKLTAAQLAELIPGFDAMIAGTEEINAAVLSSADQLKFISRVGIGLDSVDLVTAKAKNIKVSYTADAPAPAVAELTMGLMIDLLRYTHFSNAQMHNGKWHRYFGRRLGEITVGIIGTGRIGRKVLRHLSGFDPKKILIHDLVPDKKLQDQSNIEWVSKETIYQQSDLISLHLPLTSATKSMIGKEELLSMKKDAVIINTSRGGIINEQDLFEVMSNGHLSGAAIDVFEHEPYTGPLQQLENCILTAHMGSMSVDCRTRMEIEATEEAIRFLKGEPLAGEVPETEYEMRKQ